MVDEHERKVIFNSIRNDRLMKVNREKLCKIRGIYAFDKEPFIAVATSNGLVSMYHTERDREHVSLKHIRIRE